MPEENTIYDLGLQEKDNLPTVMKKLEERRQMFLMELTTEEGSARAVYHLCAELCELEKCLLT